ncbi:hypothetical protein JCM11251_003013 [Rhodosporidiobolus azoricus]
MFLTAARTTLRSTALYRPARTTSLCSFSTASPLRIATQEWEQLVGGKAGIARRQAEFEDKYRAALEAKAKAEGISVEELKERAAVTAKAKEAVKSHGTPESAGPIEAGSMDPRKTEEQLKKPEVVKPLPSAEAQAEKPAPASVGQTKENPVKPLHDIMDLSKVSDLSASALHQLWTAYHQSKGFLSAAIPTETYLRMVKSARKYPIFVLPLTRKAELPEGEAESATEMHLLEWALLPQPSTVTSPVPAPSTVLFTPLAEYKARQSWAQPYLILTHYTDLADSHGTVLMRGEISSNVTLNSTDAQVLAVRMQLFYNDFDKEGEVAAARRQLLRAFHETPEEFDVNALIEVAGKELS